MDNELQALNNAANRLGLIVARKFTDDKRNKVQKYFASFRGVSISPVLPYTELNMFLLGFGKAREVNAVKND